MSAAVTDRPPADPAPVHDAAEILRACRVLFRRGDVVEVRCLGAAWGRRDGVTLSGYFNSAGAIADAVTPIRAAGVYTTLQHVDPRCQARRANRLDLAGSTPATSDANVLGYRFLPFDADPKRPSGVSSDAAEHDWALRLARAAGADRTIDDWPDPIVADSGNGGHLLWRIDLPVEDRPLVERCLRAMAARYAMPGLVVDDTIGNPSRLWKCYGTRAAKGEDRPDRPHRLSRLLTIPERLEVVDRRLLEAFAATAPSAPGRPVGAGVAVGAPASPRVTEEERVDVPDFCRLHGLAITREKRAVHGGTLYELAVCPFDASHTRSAVIGALTSGGAHFKCLHGSCANRSWWDVRELLEPDWAARRRDAHARWATGRRRSGR